MASENFVISLRTASLWTTSHRDTDHVHIVDYYNRGMVTLVVLYTRQNETVMAAPQGLFSASFPLRRCNHFIGSRAKLPRV